MKITDYISDLLHTHDCVVIPGFGGFVSNYAPAKIHPVNHTFYPPSKNILFNSRLTSDDGLLIHSISVSREISYEQAKDEVDAFVHDCTHDLMQGKTVILEKIGRLRKDEDGRYLFDQDTAVNYLEESYGLQSFMSPAISRDSMQKRFERRFADRKLRPASPVKNKKVYWAAVVLLPVILLAGWIFFNPVYEFSGGQQTGFITLNEPERKNTELDNADVKPQPEVTAHSIEANKTETEINLAPVTVSEKETNQPENKDVIPGSRYYVIGGAFKSRENADKMLGLMRQDGYAAEDAGQNPAGLFMISYFSSPDRSEAQENLALIRRDKNPSAWLLKK